MTGWRKQAQKQKDGAVQIKQDKAFRNSQVYLVFKVPRGSPSEDLPSCPKGLFESLAFWKCCQVFIWTATWDKSPR